jgi:hypothetical protein
MFNVRSSLRVRDQISHTYKTQTEDGGKTVLNRMAAGIYSYRLIKDYHFYLKKLDVIM